MHLVDLRRDQTTTAQNILLWQRVERLHTQTKENTLSRLFIIKLCMMNRSISVWTDVIFKKHISQVAKGNDDGCRSGARAPIYTNTDINTNTL